jgi:hypothetical protein
LHSAAIAFQLLSIIPESLDYVNWYYVEGLHSKGRKVPWTCLPQGSPLLPLHAVERAGARMLRGSITKAEAEVYTGRELGGKHIID